MKIYSVADLAPLLGLSVHRVRQIAYETRDSAQPVGRRVGGVYMFTEHDLERLRARRTTPGFPLPKRG